MKKLLLLGVTGLLFSCSTDQAKTAIAPNGDCNCRTEYYLIYPAPGGDSMITEFMFSEQNNAFDCVNQQWGIMYAVSNPNYNHAKVVCE